MKDAELEEVREGLRPRWHEVRQRAVLERALETRRHARAAPARRPRVRAIAALAIATAAAVVLAIALGRRADPQPPTARVEPALPAPSPPTPLPDRSEMRIADGSLARLAAGASIEIVTQAPEHVCVRQTAGAVRYRVVHDPQRLFEVEASGVRVTVLGTEFDVELHGDRVRVAVIDGRVRLDDGAREIELGAGDTLEVGAPPPREQVEPSAPPEIERGVSLDALEARADEARRQGRHDEAAALLERLVALDPRGARGEAALFTLGGIRGAQGRHQLAARYYARYRARFPNGALAEDALAAEAIHAAEFDAERAAQLAAQYEAQYPRGTHLREIASLRDP